MADLASTIQPAVTDPQGSRAPQPERNGTAQSPISFFGLLAAALTSAQDLAAPNTPEATPTPATVGSAQTGPKPAATLLPTVDASATATAPTPTEPPPNRFGNAAADRLAAQPNPAGAPTPAPSSPLPSVDIVDAAGDPAKVASPTPPSPSPAATPVAPPDVATELVTPNPQSGPSPAATPGKAAAKSESTPTRLSHDAAEPEDPAALISVAVDQAIQPPIAAALPVQQTPPKPTAATSESVTAISANPPQIRTTASVEDPAELRTDASPAPARTGSGTPAAAKTGPVIATEPAQQDAAALSTTTAPTAPSQVAAQPPAAPVAVRSSAETSAPAAPPAAQIAQAIAEPVKVTLASPAQQPGEAHVMTIHLTPSDLGRVEIRIERPVNGPARIELAVERPETLQRLIHDQPQLQHALDQAGIPQAGRTVQFSLSTDNAPSSAGTTLSSDAGTSGGGQRSQQGYPGSPSRAPEQIESPSTFATWARSALDITA